MEIESIFASLAESMDKLNSTASLLEKAAAWLEQRETVTAGAVEKMTAAIESQDEVSQRERELRLKLEAAEQQITELRTQNSSRAGAARQTLPAPTAQLLAKQGLSTVESIQAGALDAALAGLNVEQRIAVKSQLLRAGMLTQ